MTRRFLLGMLSILVIATSGYSQNRIAQTFKKYSLLELDSKEFKSKSQTGFFKLDLSVPARGLKWELDLHVSNVIRDNYLVTSVSDKGKKHRYGTSAVPTQGYIVGEPESRVSLTINDGFVYGFVTSEGETYYIEPERRRAS